MTISQENARSRSLTQRSEDRLLRRVGQTFRGFFRTDRQFRQSYLLEPAGPDECDGRGTPRAELPCAQ